MAGLTPLEAHDLLRFADTFEERLATAHDTHSRRRGHEREKQWLTEALELVRAARADAPELLEKARDLPELADVREEFADDLQQVWVDSLERLHAGITFHAGSRSPLIETLFPHLKFPNLRKASRAAVEQYAADLERRSNLAYVTRMLQQDTFTFAPPVIEHVRNSYAKWQSCFSTEGLGEGDPQVREALLELGKRMDLVIRQARLLAEAALAPIRGAYEDSNLAGKMRRRSVKSALPTGEDPAPPAESASEEDQAPPEPSEEPAPEAEPLEAEADAEVPSPAPRKKRGRKSKSEAAAPEDDLKSEN